MDKLSTEDAFNILVNLARQTRLTHQEHEAVERAVNVVLEALKTKEASTTQAVG